MYSSNSKIKYTSKTILLQQSNCFNKVAFETNTCIWQHNTHTHTQSERTVKEKEREDKILEEDGLDPKEVNWSEG